MKNSIARNFKKLKGIVIVDKTSVNSPNLPYLGLEDIESSTGRFLGSYKVRNVKSTTFRFSNKHLLYGRLRPYLNKVLIPSFEGHCSTEIFPLKVHHTVDRKYLWYWLTMESTVNEINKTSTGARMPRANMKEVLDFQIPLPPLPEQKRIVKILDEALGQIEKAKENTEKNLINAKELFESYLNEIFSNPGKDWKYCLLNDHVKFIDYRGKTPKKTENGLRLITAKNIKMGFLQKEPEEFIHPDDYESWMTRGIPKKGDILFTTEAPLANVAQLDTEEKVAFAQRIIIFQPDISKIDQTYLKYLLLSTPVQKSILEKGTGMTVKGIKASLLKKIPIYFPNLPEQKAIVARLDALSAETKKLEEIYQKKLQNLEELRKSILEMAFRGEL